MLKSRFKQIFLICSLTILLAITCGSLQPATAAPATLNVSKIAASNIIHKVDTIADLRQITGNPGRMAVQVMGYYAPGDGGGGPVRAWKSGAAAGTYVDNGGSVIVPTGGDGRSAWTIPWTGNVQVAWFGALGANLTREDVEIQKAIDYVGSMNGGEIELGHVHRIGATLMVPYSSISLKGRGSFHNHDVTVPGTEAGTMLLWTGSAGGTMIWDYSETGAGNYKKHSSSFSGIYLNSNLTAGIGLRITSKNKGLYRDLYLANFSIAGIKTDVTLLGEAADVQMNTFSQISGRQVEVSGAFVRLEGDSTIGANTSFNIFENMHVVFKDGDAFDLRTCDNNLFIGCRASRTPAGSGNSIVAHGSDTSANSVARANAFIRFTGSAPIVGKGSPTYLYPSHNNRIISADTENGTVVPVVESGSSFWFEADKHYAQSYGLIKACMTDIPSNLTATRNKMTSESLRIKNNTANHMVLESGVSGEYEWGISVDGTTGALRFIPKVGAASSIQFGTPLDLIGQVLNTSATTGPASPLPAAPAGYLSVHLNGTDMVIPFYAP